MAIPVEKGSTEENLLRNGEVHVALDGPCMEPTFRNGQIVRVVPAPPIVSGMVGFIRAGDGYLLHRILKVVPPWAIHGGDGTDRPGICRVSEIIGISPHHSVEVTTGSMSPTIATGERVPVEQATPRIGDVALIWGEERPQVHRILGTQGEWVIHAGDASPVPGIAARSDIVGSVHVPRPANLPAARHAHALGLLLKTGSALHRVGIPTNGPLRVGMRLLKKLLSGFFLRR